MKLLLKIAFASYAVFLPLLSFSQKETASTVAFYEYFVKSAKFPTKGWQYELERTVYAHFVIDSTAQLRFIDIINDTLDTYVAEVKRVISGYDGRWGKSLRGKEFFFPIYFSRGGKSSTQPLPDSLRNKGVIGLDEVVLSCLCSIKRTYNPKPTVRVTASHLILRDTLQGNRDIHFSLAFGDADGWSDNTRVYKMAGIRTSTNPQKKSTNLTIDFRKRHDPYSKGFRGKFFVGDQLITRYFPKRRWRNIHGVAQKSFGYRGLDIEYGKFNLHVNYAGFPKRINRITIEIPKPH